LAGSARYRVTLPDADWYDTQTLALVHGGVRDLESPPGDSVRVFARPGRVVPEGPVVQNTGEVSQGPLTLTSGQAPIAAASLYL